MVGLVVAARRLSQGADHERIRRRELRLSSRKDTWVNRPAPTSQEVDQDPIGFVDRVTGRTFAAQLTLTSPTCKTSYTDDDGLTWVATAGFGTTIAQANGLT